MAPARGNRRRRPAASELPQRTDNAERDETGGRVPALPDLIRRAFTLGFSGFFLTEEAIRKALGDTLPKDWVDFAGEQSERTRTEFIERLVAEMGRAFERVDLRELAEQVLEGRTVEINTRIQIHPREASSTKVDVRAEAPRTKR